MSVRKASLVGGLALLVALCVLVVPTALADSPQDYPSAGRPVATEPIPDAAERAILRETLAPDAAERAIARELAEQPVRPDDRSGARGPGAYPTVIATVDEDVFTWSDVAIWAAVGAGIALLVAVGVSTAVRHQGPTGGRHVPT